MHRLRHQAFFYASAGQLLDTSRRSSRTASRRASLRWSRCPSRAWVAASGSRLERERPRSAGRHARAGPQPGLHHLGHPDFVDSHPGRRTRMVGEPIWRGRTPRETAEATRHEALINLAFADAEVDDPLPLRPVARRRRMSCSHLTHPELIRDGACSANPEYAASELRRSTRIRCRPAPDAAATPAGRRLGELRRWLHPQLEARRPGSGIARDDLTVAVNEAAGNAILHGGGPADVGVWREPGRMSARSPTPGGSTTRSPAGGARRRSRPTAAGCGSRTSCATSRSCAPVRRAPCCACT